MLDTQAGGQSPSRFVVYWYGRLLAPQKCRGVSHTPGQIPAPATRMIERGDSALCTAGLRASVVQTGDRRIDLIDELVWAVERDIVDGLREPDEATIR